MIAETGPGTLAALFMPYIQAEASDTLAEVLVKNSPQFSIDEVKALPENKTLFELRTETMLKEGDKIWVPDEEPEPEWVQVKVGEEVNLTVQGRLFKLVLRYPDREPMKSQPFVLTVDGNSYDGTTDADGLLELTLPHSATRGTIRVEGYRQDVLIGGMEPVTTKKGVQARLRNLGYAVGLVDGKFGTKSVAALKAFQKDSGLPVTGAASPNTRAQLTEQHGA